MLPITGQLTFSDSAIILLQRRSDLILLEVIMPEMDGYEVCKRLKRHGGDEFACILSKL